MAALETRRPFWTAIFRDLHDRKVHKPVEVVCTRCDHEPIPYYWLVVNGVGTWPGTDSRERIEVVW